MTYRNDAHGALKRAKSELATDDDERLKYAAIELRMAMEGLTYDRALTYKDELPESAYEAWQPRKVMQVLLDIDPNADKDSSFALGLQPSKGEKPSEMHSFGTETVLNLGTLKAHYDALGSYLHVQTLKAVKAGKKVDYAKFRTRCEGIVGAIDKVLASPVWNLNFKQFGTIDCDCGKVVMRRLPLDGEPTVATCECGAKYDVEQATDGKVIWRLQQSQAICPNDGCGTETWIPNHVAKHGTWWKCSGCDAKIQIRLGLVVTDKEEASVGA